MKLPKIEFPIITIEIPPANKQIPFRPMLVKEEKLLLMAKTSEDETSMLTTIKQVVNNCCLDPAFQIDLIPLYALEQVFLQLRAGSVGDTITVTYHDYEDDKSYPFTIDLKQVKIKYPEVEPAKRIEITPTAGITMRHPPAAIYDDKIFLHTEGEDSFYSLVIKCIDQVYDGDNVWPGSDFKEEDLADFLELIDIKSFDKIREFMFNMPTLYYRIEYTNSLGNAKVIELTTLSDFFTLR